MDTVTGAAVAITLPVEMPRERVWDLITAVERIGEWSPEAFGGGWDGGAQGPVPGARFIARNRFANGTIATVTCVVIEADRPRSFGWSVLDGSGLVGSTWRYELREGSEPGSTLVHHSFTHGPGLTGARIGAEADPQALGGRLGTLCQNMAATIAAMATTDATRGTNR
jgi:uncharacterized protein YndB with AHSA1/START domain